ncbi:hypothetical protein A0J61_10353 [Choanephora cucurbitarum]|uniref:Uncharacterized protein n=1 Tax=Choanephora cucurbitarum TaxID=101091 RepID=A0A1C7MYW7_9FUNG|nr:hypothetical protein A0J61_10353 [Choanephora cucurbitarum]
MLPPGPLIESFINAAKEAKTIARMRDFVSQNFYTLQMENMTEQEKSDMIRDFKREAHSCGVEVCLLDIVWKQKGKRKADEIAVEVSESSRSKSRTTASSKSTGVSSFLSMLPSFEDQLKLNEKWMVDDTDVSSELALIRRKCIEKHRQGISMKSAESLTLGSIFFFSKDRNKSVTCFFNLATHKRILSSLDLKEKEYELPSVVDSWLTALKKEAKGDNLKTLRLMLRSLLNSREADDDDDLMLVASALFSLVPKHRTWSASCVVEDTFVKNQIADVIDVILGQSDDISMHYEWCNKKLSICVLKPDYTLSIEGRQAVNVEFFVVEVKTPSRNRNSNDFVKMGFILKFMLDNMVKHGMKKPKAFGLLVDGFNCYLYKMQLLYEAIYEMTEMESFALPRSADELPLLKDFLQSMLRVKAFASEAFEELESAAADADPQLLSRCRFAA